MSVLQPIVIVRHAVMVEFASLSARVEENTARREGWKAVEERGWKAIEGFDPAMLSSKGGGLSTPRSTRQGSQSAR